MNNVCICSVGGHGVSGLGFKLRNYGKMLVVLMWRRRELLFERTLPPCPGRYRQPCVAGRQELLSK